MFAFSESDKMLREQARSFAKKELAAGAKERSKQSIVPPEIMKKVAAMGYTGLCVPEKYGGQEVSAISRGIVIEEISKVDFNIGVLTSHCQIISAMILRGSEELAAEWVPHIISTDKIGSIAITEPDCGNDIGAIKTRAVRDGDNYIINGEKTSISRGSHADICLVFAKTDPTAGTKGLTQFLVPLDLPGISREPLIDMGTKLFARASINFDNVRIPEINRLGEEGQGFARQFLGSINIDRAIVGLQVLGAAQASLDEAIAFSKQRVAFGYPIAKYEGVSFKIAEAATLLEAARWLCYYTLWLGDQGLSAYKQGAMCKWWCPHIAVDIIHNCMLIHGQVAYTEELPIEQRLRDVIGTEFGDGTAEIMKINIARQIIGQEAIPYIK